MDGSSAVNMDTTPPRGGQARVEPSEGQVEDNGEAGSSMPSMPSMPLGDSSSPAWPPTEPSERTAALGRAVQRAHGASRCANACPIPHPFRLSERNSSDPPGGSRTSDVDVVTALREMMDLLGKPRPGLTDMHVFGLEMVQELRSAVAVQCHEVLKPGLQMAARKSGISRHDFMTHIRTAMTARGYFGVLGLPFAGRPPDVRVSSAHGLMTALRLGFGAISSTLKGSNGTMGCILAPRVDLKAIEFNTDSHSPQAIGGFDEEDEAPIAFHRAPRQREHEGIEFPKQGFMIRENQADETCVVFFYGADGVPPYLALDVDMRSIAEVEPCKITFKPNTKPPRMDIVMSSMCIVTAAQLQHIQDVCQ